MAVWHLKFVGGKLMPMTFEAKWHEIKDGWISFSGIGANEGEFLVFSERQILSAHQAADPKPEVEFPHSSIDDSYFPMDPYFTSGGREHRPVGERYRDNLVDPKTGTGYPQDDPPYLMTMERARRDRKDRERR